jgi:ribose transport system substrate-binding protein
MHTLWIIILSVISVAFLALVILLPRRQTKPFRPHKFRIGFSQYNNTLPWRRLFDQELLAEAARHPEIELLYADGQFSAEKQIADLESFIAQKMNLILLSPSDADKLVPVVEKAYRAGIPLLLLDRDVHTEKFTSYIGADNFEIGQAAGGFAADLLRGKGSIVEIWGRKEPTTSGRHEGFLRVIQQFPGLRIIAEEEGIWEEEEARKIMERILAANPQVDLVYAHDDPMALGAWAAAQAAGRVKEIKFIGVDAEPGPAGGCQAVADGKLEATFLYPTPGVAGIKVALKVLNGETVAKRITLPTVAVLRDFARQYADRGPTQG